MPLKPQRPCRYPGCPHLTSDKSGYCPDHLALTRRQQDRERGNANQRGYNYRWRKYSKWYLSNPDHALCAICLKKDPPVIKAAECVDHIIPHKGDMNLFWEPDNHQPACLECNRIKAAQEEGSFGNPVASSSREGRGA